MKTKRLLVYTGASKWTPEGSVYDRLVILSAAQQLYDARLDREGWIRRNGFLISGARLLWASGLFNMGHMNQITGISRKTLRTWLEPSKYETRPRGAFNPEHLKQFRQTLKDFRPGDDTLSPDYLTQISARGTSARMATFLLGTDEDGRISISYDGDDLLEELRPDDDGHPEGSEGSSEAGDQDSSDDGHGDGEEVPEPADSGQLQGAEPRLEAPEPGTAEDEGERPQHDRVEPAKRGKKRKAAPADDEWDPWANFNPDLTGDSILQGGDQQGGSTDDAEESPNYIPGLPVPGTFWEQAEEPEA